MPGAFHLIGASTGLEEYRHVAGTHHVRHVLEVSWIVPSHL